MCPTASAERHVACVDLPAFPLQLLLKQRPDWREQPVVVVDQDTPQGTVLWANERARAGRVLSGMRYAAALALSRELRAATVERETIDRGIDALARTLRRFTPLVEPARGDDPGTFWLDASGLERLHDSLARWAGEVRAALKHDGFEAAVAVGFGRFAVFALARARRGRGAIVIGSPREERAAITRVPLDRLSLPPKARDALGKLGVRTVGAFASLPADGIAQRFGAGVERLHRLAAGELELPLQPEIPDSPAMGHMDLEPPEANTHRLTRVVERLIGPLLAVLAGRAQALAELRIGFRFERTGDHLETLRPAAPTLDAAQLMELVRLRLAAIRRLPDGVHRVVLVGTGAAASAGQLELFAASRRDPAAANRALARVRARLGDDAVVHARLREAHLPEGSFAWRRLDALNEAKPRTRLADRLVRRLQLRPIPLPPRPRHEPDGWMLRGVTDGPVVRVEGPYVVSGGWWRGKRSGEHREYHYAETKHGELLWVYYDRPKRRWFLHGRVE